MKGKAWSVPSELSCYSSKTTIVWLRGKYLEIKGKKAQRDGGGKEEFASRILI